MRILLIVTGLHLGGAERQVVSLADRLAARGHCVAIACLVGEVEVRPDDATVELHPLHFSKTPLGLMTGILRLRRLVRQWRPDVVHSHMVHANLIARAMRLVTPVPRLICTAHSTVEGGRGVMMAYRLTDRLADISTHVSREAVAVFERQGAVRPGRMLAILNGIDLRAFSDAPDRRARSRLRVFPRAGRLLLAAGRLAQEKDHAGLLGAFARVVDRLPDVELWIAGDGPLRDALLRQRDALGLENRVAFLGARRDVPDLMRAADVFVLPSRFEGFGLVVAEAMASGTLVVATDAGGVAEVLDGTGIVVPPGDEDALAAGLLEAFSMDPQRTAALTASARRRAENRLDIERSVDTWLELYRGNWHADHSDADV